MPNIITGGRASGKTTKAIQWLDEQGGGYFITRHVQEVTAIVNELDLKNADKIYVIQVGLRSIVVDDADDSSTAVVFNGPPIERPTT